MKNTTENKLDRKQIASVVKEATFTCYGISGILTVEKKKGQEDDGIYVHFEKDNEFSLDIHVFVVEGVKVTEAIRSLQKTIRFYMNRLYPGSCKKINIYAEGISSLK